MRKVLFTESQIKRILEAESVDCGYLDINSPGTEAPDNVEGDEVTMSGDKVSDRIAKIKKSGRGFQRSYRFIEFWILLFSYSRH